MFCIKKTTKEIYSKIAPVRITVGQNIIDGILYAKDGDLFACPKSSFESDFIIIDCEPPRFIGVTNED